MVCIKLWGNFSLYYNVVLICNLMYKIGVVLMIDIMINGLFIEVVKWYCDMFVKVFVCGCVF